MTIPRFVIGLIMVFGFLLVSCGPQGELNTTLDVTELVGATVTIQSLLAESSATTVASVIPDAAVSPEVSPIAPADGLAVQTTVTSTPQVKMELEATDPRGVVLASEELQLVEFFAFW